MNIIKSILAFFGMLFSGMYGGQKNKAVRRFGLPSIAIGYGFSMGWDWRYLAFLGFIPVLVMGYGVDSVLGGFLGHIEWLIRLVYAVLLGIPFVFFGLWRWIIATILLIIAFQIHAGSLGNISWFGDILIEDIIRYSTLTGLIVFTVLTNKTR